jgi:polysaccharide export outer membrane protein
MTHNMTTKSLSTGFRQTRFAAALAVTLVFGSALPARADYIPQRGDVLEVTVSRAPALNRRVLVNGDGKIALPFLGDVEAAELSLSDLRRRVGELLVAKNVVDRPDVTVSVAEYGPIYLDGDLAKPGEYRFRPEMTIRNAISLAGGLDTSVGQSHPTTAQFAEAWGDYGSTAIEFARQKARAARLRAELNGAATFEVTDPADPSVETTVMVEIQDIENRQLQAERQAETREKAHLERMIGTARAELAALEQAEAQQSSMLDQQLSDATRSQDLLQKGVSTFARTEETQRALAQARTQLIEVRVRLAQAKKELQERLRNLETFDDDRRAKLLEGLRDAVAEAGKAEYRLEAARKRMSGRPEALSFAVSGAVPNVTIRRLVKGATVRIVADLDTKLQSGDSVEVVTTAATSRMARRTESRTADGAAEAGFAQKPETSDQRQPVLTFAP